MKNRVSVEKRERVWNAKASSRNSMVNFLPSSYAWITEMKRSVWHEPSGLVNCGRLLEISTTGTGRKKGYLIYKLRTFYCCIGFCEHCCTTSVFTINLRLCNYLTMYKQLFKEPGVGTIIYDEPSAGWSLDLHHASAPAPGLLFISFSRWAAAAAAKERGGRIMGVRSFQMA